MKVLSEGFNSLSFEVNPFDFQPDVSEKIEQSLSRLLAWDSANKVWRQVLVDTSGRLYVSTNAVPVSSAKVSNPNVTSTPAVLLIANPNRRQVIIQNNSSTDMYIGFGSLSSYTLGLKIAANGAFIDDVFVGEFWAATQTGSMSPIIVEY